MTITQTIEVPADRRILLDLPKELPTGKARFTLTTLSVSEPVKVNEKIRLTKSMIDEIMQDETVLALTGILHTEMSHKEIREERLAKYAAMQ